MLTVWKYPLRSFGRHDLVMPQGAVILDVQTQREVPCMWALVDDEGGKETRVFEIIGTGHEFNAVTGHVAHVGTFQVDGGEFVFHVFEHLHSREWK